MQEICQILIIKSITVKDIGHEKIFDKAGIQQKVTASLKENLGNTTREEFAVNNLAALDEFRFINKELGKHSNIIWKVIVNNNPATKERMDELRDALDKLILYFDIQLMFCCY